MESQLDTQSKALAYFNIIRAIFYKLISLILIYIAITYWMQVLGISQEGAGRFDLLPEHWQAASIILCVLMPVAALGLWGGFSWGVVIWFITAITELVMYQAMSHLFGENPNAVYFHLLCMVIFAILISLASFMENKK